MVDEEERASLRAVAKGDRAALRRLYDRHYPGLFQFVRARIGDAATAADIIQETFLVVWRQASGFRSDSNVKTWIYAIARNKTMDRLRQVRAHVDIDDVAEPEDTAPLPEDISGALSDARRVRACIHGLSAAHQSVIRLAFYEDCDYAQIAEIEGVPVGTVKTRIFHAKKLLMRCLAGIARN